MITYWDYYNNKFAPKLKEIDLFLKTSESSTYSVDAITELLDISDIEIKDLMREFNIESIDKLAFFTFMQYGSSKICRLFKRLVQRNIPHLYSIDDISFIYQLPYETVLEAANKTNLNNITEQNLKTLFSNIYIPA